MLKTNFTCRWSASPWWPLVVWLGLPATLSNLSISSWPVLHSHVALSAFQAGKTPSAVPMEVLQFAMFFSVMLIGAQVMVVSLVLCCSSAKFWKRLLQFGIMLGFILVSGFSSIPVAYMLERCLVSWRNSLWLVQDVKTDFEVNGFLAGAATLPMVLLGIQAPFWLLRSLPGWRLQRSETTASTGENQATETYSIRHLMAATAIVAVSLALVQAADGTDQMTANSHLFNTLLLTGMLAALGTCVGLPLTVLFLRNQAFPTRWVLAWILLTMSSGIIRLCCAGLAQTALIKVFSGAVFSFFAFFAAYLLAVVALRLNGWRLVDRCGSKANVAGVEPS